MNSSEFNRLCTILERFESASPRWTAILVHLFQRCDGFIEDFTLHETTTCTHLILKTSELLKSLPDHAGDAELAQLLAQEFEGWYFTAIGSEERWNSLVESYSHYKKRIPKLNDLSVTTKPHAAYDQSFRYINDLLSGAQSPQGFCQ